LSERTSVSINRNLGETLGLAWSEMNGKYC
jgi:hypothetical protein